MKFYIVLGVLSTLEHFFLFWMYFSGSLCIFFSFFVDLLLIILFFSYIAIFSGNVFIFTDFRWFTRSLRKKMQYFQKSIFNTQCFVQEHTLWDISIKRFLQNHEGSMKQESQTVNKKGNNLKFFTWKSSAVRCFQCKTL